MKKNQVIIKIVDVVHSKSPLTEQDGDTLYDKLNNEINKNDSEVILDFSGVDSVTVAFINNSISKFIQKDGIDEVSTYLKISNLKDDFMKNLINISLEFAQDKYISSKNRTSNA